MVFVNTSNMLQKNSRISWIDMAKGYGTLFIILGHLGNGGIFTWVYTFHVPLFFFLSGYVFSDKQGFVGFLKKKCKSLVIPYFCLGMCMVIFHVLRYFRSGNYSHEWCMELITSFLLQRRLWTLWYTAALFCLNIVFYLMLKTLKKDWIMGIVSLILPVIGLFYYKVGGDALIWNADVCLMAIPFFYVGYIYKKYSDKLDIVRSKKGLVVVSFVLFCVLNLVCGYLSIDESGMGLAMFYSQYGEPIFSYIAAFAGIICVVIVSKSTFIRPIRYIGENSMLYYAWHQTIMMPVMQKILSVMGLQFLRSNGVIGYYVYRIIMLVGIVALTTLCNWIIKKIGLKFILGK